MSLPKDIILDALPENICLCTTLDSIATIRKKAQNSIVLFDAKDADARKIVESCKPQLVFNSEYHKKGDHGHQVNSGLDLPTFKFMKTHGLLYGIDAKKLYSSLENTHSVFIISRFKQNISLAKKAGTQVVVFSGSGKVSDSKRSHLIDLIQ